MIYKYQYTDSTDRQAILDANSEKVLIEEQNITEGNFLIFVDSYPVDNNELKQNQLILMDAVATLFETIITPV